MNFKLKTHSINESIVTTEEGIYLLSYDTVISLKPYDNSKKIELDERYWNYSATTGKHRNNFLCETREETEKKIKSGEYILTNLNK